MKTLERRKINEEQFQKIVSKLADYCKEQFPKQSCFIHGMGGQTKSTYLELSKVAGVSVRLIYSCLPPSLFFLRFIPSYAGLVQILDASRLYEMFDKIGESGFVCVYIFNSDRNKDFIEFINKKPHTNEIEKWFENVNEGLLYRLATSDYLDWLMIGDAVPVSDVLIFEKLWKEVQ
jgi:hypothetical protein